VGSTMGTLDELKQLIRFCVASGVRPLIDEALPLREARRGLEALAAGSAFGKLVLVGG
jgi:D-arabinose 1-dehydrogenase-like Zn-dependent alcohol dehydrogenase